MTVAHSSGSEMAESHPGLTAPPDKTQVMGIINATPDSFYDGGCAASPEDALRQAEAMVRDGAHILDVGAESSRPGAEAIGAEEELERLLPVLEALEPLPVPVSVDTFRAETARRALELGAAMINDISGLRMDPEMPSVVAEAGCPCVIMHMLGTPKTMQEDPRYEDVVDDICAFFEARIAELIGQGVREEQIWLDPGFGFGKTIDHNLSLLRRLGEFKRLGRPILIGASNKSTIGTILDLPVEDRDEGTAATVAIAIAQGVDCVRVHNVKAMARVARMSDAIMQGRA
jgi:dihydropteroate synthase